MVVDIGKPQNEEEFANLYNTVSEAIQAIDEDLDEYLLEPSIGDDCEFEEITDLFRGYYMGVRNMQVEITGETADTWTLSIIPLA